VPFVSRQIKDGESVLEIGAFNRDLGQRLKRIHPHIRYKSLDADSSFPHDYFSFDEIDETFDVVLLFEVIEHFDLKRGAEMVAKIYSILNPGGRIVLTTPNVYTPGRYWKDAEHLTAYHYEELGAVFLRHGFEIVDLRRVHNSPYVQYVLRVYLLSPLFRFLGIDFAKSILLVARKGS
jgi:SAM-dependent methyltransferase